MTRMSNYITLSVYLFCWWRPSCSQTQQNAYNKINVIYLPVILKVTSQALGQSYKIGPMLMSVK